ncbi:MAG: quinolinate synthase NadA [Limnohabitans sp.]|nr:quinolinate synthase NadA [Limnohabitans sp.]
MLWQPSLPERYLNATETDLARAIATRRAELGSKLLILGHHYQQDAVIQHADLIGDSLKLSQLAAAEAPRRGAKYIVFCGVHFMAETADILTSDDVEVMLPDLSAGCSMADMAAYDDTVDAWESIQSAIRASGRNQRVIPITYVNSTAAIKAFVGQHGGACCTSSNAMRVFEWALAGGDSPTRRGSRGDAEEIKILFLPDQHLGRNTAKRHGLVTEVDAAASGRRAPAQTALWNPKLDDGGLSPEEIVDAKVLLWAGHCSVHKLFRPEHVAAARKDGRTVLVHPECAQEVVDIADLAGSTEYIIDEIARAEAGSRWAVGTEVHLVNRIAQRAQERSVDVSILSDCQCLCTTMYRIDQAHLSWCLDHLAAGKVVNRISVHPDAKKFAKLALERMLALAPTKSAHATAVD